jgi:hypothetical protein
LYDERCAADELWLESAANAVFCKEFVDLVLSWLARPEDDLPVQWDWDGKFIDLKRGDALPRFDDLRRESQVSFLVPTWGHPELLEDPTFRVHLIRCQNCCMLWMEPRGNVENRPSFYLGIERYRKEQVFVLNSFRFPAPPLPLLGLGLMALKRVAMELAAVSDSPDQAAADWHRSYWGVRWEEEEEEKRALRTLRMVAWRSRRQLPRFRVVWFKEDS